MYGGGGGGRVNGNGDLASKSDYRGQISLRAYYNNSREANKSTAETTADEAKGVEATTPAAIDDAAEEVVATGARFTAQLGI